MVGWFGFFLFLKDAEICACLLKKQLHGITDVFLGTPLASKCEKYLWKTHLPGIHSENDALQSVFEVLIQRTLADTCLCQISVWY